MDEALVSQALLEQLPGLSEDGDAQEYFKSLIMDTTGGAVDEATITETLAPFVESYGLAADTAEAEALCGKLCKRLREMSGLGGSSGTGGGKSAAGGAATADDGPKLLDKAVVFSDLAKSQISEAEQATLDTLWGFDKIRKSRNEQFEATDILSAKDERKAAKEQKRWLEELENKFVGDEEDEEEKNQISSMTLPDLSGASRERDIHVNNFTITFGGKVRLRIVGPPGSDLTTCVPAT